MSEINLVVNETAGTGMRIDRYCALQNDAVSRSRLKNGALTVMVNGQKAKMSRNVRKDDIITVSWEDPIPEQLEAENIPLDILYEDETVTVVNKAQGMVTHPAAGNWSGTLVHALLWHWKRSAPEGNYRPGIVHRLDKDTSGVIVTARNLDSEAWLQNQFRSRKVYKIYAAILMGIPRIPEGDIRTQIMRDPKNRKKFICSSIPERGRSAHTSYRVIRTYGHYSLVLFRLHTGRTHQLRVHSRFLGCPILGDPVYGKKDRLFPDATMMLHARSLRICLPGSETTTLFEAPVPPRFKTVLKALKEEFAT
jgi:23S rRNA pseudouridine1911/1915/1917 synthase